MSLRYHVAITASVIATTVTIWTILPRHPDIVFDSLVFDAGDVVQGQRVTHTFTFRNKGAAVATIHNISTSCGCSATAVTKNTFEPNESGELFVNVDTSNMDGPLRTDVELETGATLKMQHRLKITGTVTPDLQLSARFVDL